MIKKEQIKIIEQSTDPKFELKDKYEQIYAEYNELKQKLINRIRHFGRVDEDQIVEDYLFEESIADLKHRLK